MPERRPTNGSIITLADETVSLHLRHHEECGAQPETPLGFRSDGSPGDAAVSVAATTAATLKGNYTLGDDPRKSFGDRKKPLHGSSSNMQLISGPLPLLNKEERQSLNDIWGEPNTAQPNCDSSHGSAIDKDFGRDLRCVRPRLVPRMSRWDRRNSDSLMLQSPVPLPNWIHRLHLRLPWYQITVDSGGGPWLTVQRGEVPNAGLLTELRGRWKLRGDRFLLFARSAIVIALIFTLFIINVVQARIMVPPIHTPIIVDVMHNLFVGVNQAFHDNEALFSAMMFIGSLFMDIVVFWIFGYWALLGDSLRLPIAYGLLYGLRAVMRMFNVLPFPERYIWDFPKLGSVRYRSITVPFKPADDFFYSGHVGCATLATIEHFYNRHWAGGIYSIVAICFTLFLMFSTRGHYTIDLICGMCFASWLWMIAEKLAKPIDALLAIPPRPIFNRSKFMERHNNPVHLQGSLHPNFQTLATKDPNTSKDSRGWKKSLPPPEIMATHPGDDETSQSTRSAKYTPGFFV